jgi:hypothetical protein
MSFCLSIPSVHTMKRLRYLFAMMLVWQSSSAQNSFRNYYWPQNTPLANAVMEDRVLQTSDSGYLILSHFTDSAIKKFALSKMDAYGNIQWSYKYHFIFSFPYQYATSFAELPDKSFAIVCAKDSAKILYWHIDSIGQIISIKGYKADSTNSLFATFTDAAGHSPDLVVDTDGSILLGAGVSANMQGLPFAACNWLLKIEEAGNPQWSIFFRRDSLHLNSNFRRITKTLHGSFFGYDNFFVIDTLSNTIFYTDVFKVNGAGLIEWYKQIGVDFCTVKFGSTSTGDLLLSGNGPQNTFLMKLDSMGNTCWAKQTVAFGYPGAITEMRNGNYLFTKNGFSPEVIVLDTSGNTMGWGKRYTPILSGDYFNLLIPTNDNGFIAVGENDTIGFVLLKADSLLQTGCNETQVSLSIPDVVTSDSTGFVQVNAAVTVTDVTANGYATPLSYSMIDECLFSNLAFVQQQNSFDIYPNPCTHHVTISGMQFPSEEIEIRDLPGAKVYCKVLDGKSESVSIAFDLVPGIYFVRVSSGKNSITKKLMVQ